MQTHRIQVTVVVFALLVLGGCSSSSPPASTSTAPSEPRASAHAVVVSQRGTPTSLAALEAVLDQPGPLEVETHRSARWTSPRSGLINLEHPKASELSDGPEPVDVYFHVVAHPTQGRYLIDTGVESALADAQHPLRTSAVGEAFGFGSLEVEAPLGAWLADGHEVAGVFLTHLHLDHVLGVPDLAASVPLFVGPGETELESAFHGLTQPAVDERLAGRPALQQWDFRGAPALDVFGDQSLFVFAMAGHTPGSVALLARSTRGPILFTGDTCHTAWGWENGVEPGSFSHDRAANAASLAQLRGLAARHPGMEVRLGHQERGGSR